jgi:hypothetical protein
MKPANENPGVEIPLSLEWHSANLEPDNNGFYIILTLAIIRLFFWAPDFLRPS